MWLGANDLVKRFNWVWETTRIPVNYTNWDKVWGNPSNTNGNEQCLQMWMKQVRRT